MAARTRAAATRPPPAAVSAPCPPPTAARRRRQGLPAPPGRTASGRPEEELQEGSGTKRSGSLPAQHGPGRNGRRELPRVGSPPARKARATPAAVSLSPPAPVCSPVPSKVNRRVTRSISQSARTNAAVANKNTNTADMRTRTDDTESLRRRLTVALSQAMEENLKVRRGLKEIMRLKDELTEEKLNVTRGQEESIRLRGELIYLKKSHITALERELEMVDELRYETDALQKLRVEKEAEIQELKMQKQAELQKLRVQKEAEIQELKVQKQAELQKLRVEKQAELQKVKVHKEAEVQKVIKENIRLLRIVDKKEAQLQAMSEHCKLLVLKNRN
ncbi:unnamed protein product [Urochloa decumbens]|uniref:Uncharacterized protein n=1 Tax=Urochloa decumbens TaxID=240449 RepID=A0ABC9E382_9POAL